ncbi:MAG: hypothetical protein H7256_16000 [Bdellovibrio sp.]|nr:hypothetical protein [Bdellovibrio sp.]
MKTILALSLLMVGSMSYASSEYECKQEAQILAKITKLEKRDMMGCTAYVTASSIQIYNESQACALHLDDVLASGVELPTVNGHDCDLGSDGQTLKGILTKQADGSITIDRD